MRVRIVLLVHDSMVVELALLDYLIVLLRVERSGCLRHVQVGSIDLGRVDILHVLVGLSRVDILVVLASQLSEVSNATEFLCFGWVVVVTAAWSFFISCSSRRDFKPLFGGVAECERVTNARLF